MQMKAVEYYESLEKYDERYWRDPRFLEKVVHNFVEKYYDVDVKIPVKINGRLGKALGRFVFKIGHKKSLRIEMNKNFIEHAPKAEIISVIIHEAIHHALYEIGEPFRDGQPTFENEIKRHGSHSTRVLRPKMKRETYVCGKCLKMVATRTRKSSALTKRYTSACCGASVIYGGSKIV